MSELIQKNDSYATIRWKLLTGVSALALTAYVASADFAKADDSGRPQIWIELGGQLSSLGDGQETFAPDFPNSPARPSVFSSSQKFEQPPHFSIDEEGKLSFQPEDSSWVLSASIRYGRSARNKQIHQQTVPAPFVKYYYTSNYAAYYGGILQRHKVKNVDTPQNAKFADTLAKNSERHLILDFQAGKDFGLGMFGKDGSSVVSLGVRFAQFSSKTNIALKSDPDWKFNYKYLPSVVGTKFLSSKFAIGSIYHSNAARLQATRNFRGVGPSLSWSASAPFAGNLQDGELDFDWGVNAALLFGRQRAHTHHQTTGRYNTKYSPSGRPPITHQNPATPDHTRSRNVTVPNIGGSAGLSFRYTDAKISIGYRADFFLGAMDTGIDAAKKSNLSFNGPFASISFGIGD